MRLCHTSDWHLGQMLHGHSREQEHHHFLDWLANLLASEKVDALLISGDIFDHSNPPVTALRAWNAFLGRLTRNMPNLDVVAIGGNHDSAARLESIRPLLSITPRLHLIGGVPFLPGRELDLERLAITLRGPESEPRAVCALLPFIRLADLPPVPDDGVRDPLIEGVRQLYARVFERARELAGGTLPIIGMGHCYLAGTALSEMSERKILGGNQHALPRDIFPDDLAYVALGHLHRAQKVGGDARVRYAGSPLPLAMDEADYPHQVLLIDLEAGETTVTSRRVPRHREMIRIGPAEPEAALRALEAIPDHNDNPIPFLETRVILQKPEPGLRRRIEEAVRNKHVNLVRVSVTHEGDRQALADRVRQRTLAELRPDEVFAGCHRRSYQREPSDEMQAMFAELLDDVGRGES